MHRPQPISVEDPAGNYEPDCNDIATMAEREFAAFTRAVAELFGPEQSKRSADDWLDELASMDCLPGPASREWRLVTLAALARLAIRMTVAIHCPSANHRAA
jgi:hypothetical protein